jgi:hypothetical protein
MLPFLFKKKSPDAFGELKSKWENKYKELQENIWVKHGEAIHNFLNISRQWSIGTLAGFVMLASSGVQTAAADSPIVKITPLKDLNSNAKIQLDLLGLVPRESRPLTQDEEIKLTSVLSNQLGLSIKAEMQGIRLNTNYGLIGAEQHLARFPGDTMTTHLQSEEDNRLYYSSGMAPGLGAWRYFANSSEEMTKEDDLREKYYVAVQTFLSPGFEQNVKRYGDFFKFRKVLVINPQNGKAIVGDIGDAGPSPWTGKQFGGSPEVMHYLERVDGAQKGTVLIFFIDDPADTVPLGPIEI